MSTVRCSAFAGLVLCASLVGCKEPKWVQMDAKALIPNDAELVVAFELEPLRRSPIGPALRGAMEGDSDMQAMVKAVPICKADLSGLKGLLATTGDGADKFVAVIESPGIGDEGVVRCFEKEVAKATGEDAGIIFFETRGEVRITPQEGGGYLIILNPNTVVIVDKPWEDAVFAAIEEPEQRGADSALAKSVKAIDADTDLWIAYQPTDPDRKDMTDVPGLDALASVSVTANLDAGMGLHASLDFSDPSKALAFGEALPALADGFKSEVTAIGLPEALLDGIKPTVDDARVSTDLNIPADTLPKMLATLGPLLAE